VWRVPSQGIRRNSIRIPTLRSLLVAPPPFGRFSPFMELFFRGGEATGGGLAAAYRTVAEASGARFLDAASVLPPGPVDGVHPDADGQRRLGSDRESHSVLNTIAAQPVVPPEL